MTIRPTFHSRAKMKIRHHSDMDKNKDYFEGYPWPKNGARYGELIAWLKENSGYTSNRVTDMILRNAQLNGTVTKRLNTRKYYPVTPR